MKKACVPASVYILSRFQLAENNNRHTVQAGKPTQHNTTLETHFMH